MSSPVFQVKAHDTIVNCIDGCGVRMGKLEHCQPVVPSVGHVRERCFCYHYCFAALDASPLSPVVDVSDVLSTHVRLLVVRRAWE